MSVKLDVEGLRKVATREAQLGPGGYSDGKFWKLDLPSTVLALLERIETLEGAIRTALPRLDQASPLAASNLRAALSKDQPS